MLVSIIVPVFNSEKTISDTLESIANQTYGAFEAIIINDGSTDGSLDICHDFIKRDSRFRIISISNHGVSYARNVGIDASVGEYITFCDSDDTLEPEYLQVLVREAKKHNADVSMCAFYTDKMTEPNKEIEDVSIVLDSETALLELLKSRYYTDTPVCKLIRRELLDDIRFPVNKRHEDTAVVYKILGKSKTATFVSFPLYYYYQHPDSFIGQGISIASLDKIDALNDMEVYLKMQFPDVLDEFYKFYYNQLIQLVNAAESTDMNGRNRILKRCRKNLSNHFVPIIKSKNLHHNNKILFSLYIISEKFYFLYIKRSRK